MTFFVWARIAPVDYAPGQIVRAGHGVFLHAAETEAGARAAMAEDPAWYETADGRSASLFIVEGDEDTRTRIVSGPHPGSSWPLPYAPKRYSPGGFVSLAEEVR